jgi:glyoxylase-like metal-dependent hydrolase (beta-lactamase superfamily II)
MDGGGDRNYTYFLADKDGGTATVIDPGSDITAVLDVITKYSVSLNYVINTHSHFDHTGGNKALLHETNAKLAVQGSSSGADICLNDGDVLPLGECTLKIIHTPGHTKDSICIFCDNVVITGDTLFVGKIGGTYSESDAREEYKSLHEKLLTLPEETRVYPGHNYGIKPYSTIGEEKNSNPFLIQKSFNEFLYLKDNWAEYKKKHGIM